MSRRSREAALVNLLGISNLPESPEEYPETVTLPDNIHANSLRAVGQTVSDGREHSIRYNFRLGRWIGGAMLAGTALSINKQGKLGARANLVHCYVPRRHLQFHTHPNFQPDIVERATLLEAAADGWDKDKIEQELNDDLLWWEATTPLPSIGDIGQSLGLSPGLVASLLSSSEGHYLWVRKDVRHNDRLHDPGPTKGPIVTPKQKTESLRDGEAEIIQRQLSVDRTRAEIMALRTSYLNEFYVCYHASEVGSSELARQG